ncbi:hypothetical protein [Streptomyces sp. NPDC051218]|uniref:hypothetical protein n=1 Tax=Streptomyces sp. NPDC051218 TaxID=3365645 RepID=UPI00379D4A3F
MHGRANFGSRAVFTPIANVDHETLLPLHPFVLNAVTVTGSAASIATRASLLLNSPLSPLMNAEKFLKGFSRLIAHSLFTLFGRVVYVVIHDGDIHAEIL